MDYFSQARRRNNSLTQDRLNAPLPPTVPTPGGGQARPQRPINPAGSYESLRAPSSIRIRRIPSGQIPQLARPTSQQAQEAVQAVADNTTTGRRRSTSEPQRYGTNLAPPAMDLSRQRTQGDAQSPMPTVTEGVATGPRGVRSESQDFVTPMRTPRPETPETPSVYADDTSDPAERIMTGASAMHSAGNAARANRGLSRFRTGGSAMRNESPAADEYGSDVVDYLDLVGMYHDGEKA